MEAAIETYFSNLAAMNPEGWLSAFAADAIVCDPVGTPPRKAHEDSEAFFGLLSRVFQRLDISLDHIFLAGGSVAVKWTLQGWAKNGQQGSAEGISVFALDRESKIQTVSSYWNDAAFMTQFKP
jgi:hypothetical protein